MYLNISLLLLLLLLKSEEECLRIFGEAKASIHSTCCYITSLVRNKAERRGIHENGEREGERGRGSMHNYLNQPASLYICILLRDEAC